MKSFYLFLCALAGVSALRPPFAVVPRQATNANTASVDLAVSKGPPKHLASGILYGVPDKPNQIPDHWYTDIGFNYCRSGGAQLPAPARGWTWGPTEYKNRLNSYLSNYVTCQKYGAPMILLLHDVWGTDSTNASSVWPGDRGDWRDWDNYVRTLMADLKANNALKDLIIDIWNEPDIDIFWKRSIQQWVDLYIRTHKLIRSDSSFNNVKIQGPSMAFRPLADNPWWTIWLKQIAGNNTVPEQWSYHLLGEINAVDNDIQTTNATFGALLKQYGLPNRQININEYAAPAEQIPSGAAWWISRLERYDAIGLRANWVMGASLHDLLANLLTKVRDAFDYAATDYAPNGEYQVYKYYNLNMTGTRLKTTGSTDRQLDVYATFDKKKVRILTGARFVQGLWYVKVDNLSALGLPTSGQLTIQTWGFEGRDVWQIVNAPSDRGLYTHTYSGNSLTFPIFQNDQTTAWSFEFNTP